MSKMPQALSEQDQASLLQAYQHLEYPSFAARLSSVIGAPIELTLKLMPKTWYFGLHKRVEQTIEKALIVAISSLQNKPHTPASNVYHKTLGIFTGALGGFFGGPAMIFELPITTTLMLRTIADIARSEGEDIDTIEGQLACMQVFALGGRSKEDDAADTGYYGIRLALQASMTNATRFIAGQGLNGRSGAPVLVSLITNISQRFGVVLSEKAAAGLIPVCGAVGGAFINSVFIQHFQDMAWSHFTIRRLERKYNPLLIQAAYDKIRKQSKRSR
jgi:hypothetical protein